MTNLPQNILRIYLFGDIEAYWGSSPIVLTFREKRMLAYLILNIKESRLTSEKLAAEFYTKAEKSDGTVRKDRASLYDKIGAAAKFKARERGVRVERPLMEILKSAQVDLLEFNEIVKTTSNDDERLLSAIALYRRGELLKELENKDYFWVTSNKKYNDEQCLKVVSTVVTNATARGDYNNAEEHIDFWEKLENEMYGEPTMHGEPITEFDHIRTILRQKRREQAIPIRENNSIVLTSPNEEGRMRRNGLAATDALGGKYGMDPQLLQSIWQFILNEWDRFVDAGALGASTEIGRQSIWSVLILVRDQLFRTDEGKNVLDAASSAPQSSEVQEKVKALLERAVSEDPEFAANLAGKFQQPGMHLQQINNKGADIEKQINISTNSGPITM